ncbi:iron-sulfur cluster assembly accessory protein, partial [Klebsiella pneumoniae]
GIKTSGCAGFGYVLEMIAEPAPDDLLFESDGAKLFAPLQAMPFIDGTELDYVREGLNEIFKFHNPKAQHECGCGE